jgi:hypothetical protein
MTKRFKRLYFAVLLLLFFAALPGGASAFAQDAARDHSTEGAAERPNIVVILAEDMGYSDIGPYGGSIHTPALYRLADGGVDTQTWPTYLPGGTDWINSWTGNGRRAARRRPCNADEAPSRLQQTLLV